MKLRKEFLTHNTDSESLLVPMGGAGFSGLVRGNRTLGAILELLKTDTTREGLISAMHDRYQAPAGAIEPDVDRALAELRKIGALDE